MYYLTIGYPLGSEIINNRQVYQVSLNSRIFRLLPIEYRIWSRFLLGADDTEVESTLSEQDQYGFVPTLNKLLHAGLLQPISNLRKLKFMRQGIGVGFNPETKVFEIIFGDKLILSANEYAIWKEADGVITYNEIARRINIKLGYSIDEIRKILINLCRKGLVIAINQEKGEMTDEII